MKTRFFYSLLVVSVLFSCIDRDYGVPQSEGNCVSRTATKTVAEVNSLATPVPTLYEDDDVIEAYVTSSDEGGNFFKSISMVSTDNGVGFSIPVDQVTLFADYEPGRKVYVNLKNRFISVDHSSMVIGNQNINENFPSGLSRLELFEYRNVIQKSCDKVDEETLVIKGLTIAEAVNNNNLHKLIEFDNVQFSGQSVGKTYFDPSLNSSGNATNHNLIDQNGNSVIVRVSLFSNFSGVKIPAGSGKVRGVLTKFNNTFQFMPRSIGDINLDNPRLYSFDFVDSLNENFESYANNFTNFTNYVNFDMGGGRLWTVNTFQNNKYLQMTAFNSTSPQPLNKSYFLVPVNFDAISTLSFKTQDRFYVGDVLKVYYSTDYIPFTSLDSANVVDISSNFTFATGNTGSNSLPFVNSGVYTFPAGLSGNGFIIFEYTGGYSFTPALTTNYHIDDIVIN
jgi:hypothetical protein